MNHKIRAFVAAAAVGGLALAASPASAAAASYSTDFTGITINDGSGWRMTGPFDAEIADGALRISNAVTSGSFGNQLFAPELAVAASDDAANTFHASFTLKPVDLQPGLRITVSPDNGEGGRGGFISIEHTADGVKVVSAGSFFRAPTVDDAPGDIEANGLVLDWTYTTVAEGLDPSVEHTVAMKLQKKANTAKNTNNDVFTVKVDAGVVKNTTFEAYYQATGEPNYEVNTLLFRLSGAPVDTVTGMVIDDLTMKTA
jgi:hypothetical protein